MSACELIVHVDRRGESYRPGEVIAGHVEVRVSSACKCDGLDVAVEYYTHGKGNVSHGRIVSERLWAGEWAPGEHRYPFRLTAPDAPRAYHGELLNVEHRVRATADIPWAFDPEATQDIEIVHERHGGLAVTWDEAKFAASSGGWGGMLGVGVVLLVGSGAAIAFDLAYGSGEGPGIGCGITGAIFGLLAFFGALKPYLARRKTGDVRVWLVQQRGGGYRGSAGEGAGLDCRVKLAPGLALQAVTAKLVVRERVEKGSGSSKTTHTHVLHHDPIVLEPSGEPGTYAGRLRLPAPGAAPYTFTASDNAIQWLVEVRVDIPDWPDWEENIPLIAGPERTAPTG